jgi:hypothetical protein
MSRGTLFPWILKGVRSLLGEDVVYFGMSSARNGSQANENDRNFHVDSRADDRDYSKPYPLLR